MPSPKEPSSKALRNKKDNKQEKEEKTNVREGKKKTIESVARSGVAARPDLTRLITLERRTLRGGRKA